MNATLQVRAEVARELRGGGYRSLEAEYLGTIHDHLRHPVPAPGAVLPLGFCVVLSVAAVL